jgi:hypothetical protein
VRIVSSLAPNDTEVNAEDVHAEATSGVLITGPGVPPCMPPTMEVKCLDEDCFLDMFENHYTYDVPDDHGVADLTCPVCGGTNLEEIEL